MTAFSFRWDDRFTPEESMIGIIVLIMLLIVGELLYISVSSGRFFEVALDMKLAVGITAGLVVLTSLLWIFRDRHSSQSGLTLSAWGGAFVGGAAGVWLLFHIPNSPPFGPVYGDALTILNIGVAVGMLVGITTVRGHRSGSQEEPARESVVTESTWATRSGRNPIVMELVEVLSDLTDTSPRELGLLSTYIEPEVFQHLRAEGNSSWQLGFFTSEYEIRVNSHGTITVYDVQKREEESGTTAVHSSQDRDGVSPGRGGSDTGCTLTNTPSAAPVQKVRKSIAELEQVNAAELPPLEEWIEPLTQDALSRPWEQLESTVEFTYMWYHVTVHPDGEVHVRSCGSTD